MSEMKLDTNNDIAIENFNFVIVDGEENVAQRLKTNLAIFKGEWFLDTTRGVPYYQEILKKNPDSKLIEAEFKAAIVNTDGIAKLKSFEMEYDNSLRKLTIAFTAQTDEGLEISLQEVV